MSDPRSMIREAAGAELVERLEHLDAHRSAVSSNPPQPPLPPTAQCVVDVPVALVGGGLSILLAAALAQRNIPVWVFERARAGVAHREWNASRAELLALVRAGILSVDDLQEFVIAAYDEGFCRWHGGGTYAVTGVLDRAVDAGKLLLHARRTAESCGARFFDHHELVSHAAAESAVRLRFRHGSSTTEVVARVMLDARGAQSPYAQADLLCPTVGGVMTGLHEGDGPEYVNPKVGEILVTTEDIDDGRQHIWEAFPGSSGQTTVYLFYYASAVSVPPRSLLDLYARFFAHLPRYKRGEARLVRPTFGYIPGWSRLCPAPQTESPRVILVGDAAARHSPLTFCGFGAMLRSLEPVCQKVQETLAHAALQKGSEVAVDDRPLHGGTGALSWMMANAARYRRADSLNALLNAAFATLQEMGDEAYGALLRDEMAPEAFLRFLWQTSRRHPTVYRDVWRVMGAVHAWRWARNLMQARHAERRRVTA